MNGGSNVLVAALALAACTPAVLPASVATPPATHPTPPPTTLRAAARRVDITPPPGVSTFGHGPDALVTEGFWTRIECRVFALEQGPLRVAVVPCDLAASSTILQREVAARLVGVVPTTRIFMTATHTHAGPAHYLDEVAFGGPESTHAPGFDPHMVTFLADRIACAVREAFAHLVPAEVRSVHFEEGTECNSGDCGMWGISWNRSLLMHRAGGVDPPAPPGVAGVDAAIDPSLHWIELRATETRAPIGALAFYAMHPTVLPNTNRLIGADVDGIVSRLLEAHLRAETTGPADDPPVGVVNTNEGDMSPVWCEGTKQEAIEVARRIDGRIQSLRSSSPSVWKTEVALDARYREVELRGEGTSDGGSTCGRSELGESVGYGACDHPTTAPDSPLPMAPCGACQVPKRTPLGELEHVVAGRAASFPTHLPVGLVRIDDSLVAFVPAETTIHAGRLMRQAVLGAGTGATHAFIGGLSNGYILYVTSKDEYGWRGKGGGCLLARDNRQRQSYEGSSNLYGPHVAQYLADTLESLARGMRGADVEGMDKATPARYATGPVRDRLAVPSDPPLPYERRAVATCTLPGTRAVCFRWIDGPVGDVGLVQAPWISLVGEKDAPVTGPLGPVDDRGFDFVTRVGVADDARSAWSTLFVVDPSEGSTIGPRREVAIRVQGAAGKTAVRSSKFTLDALPAACSAAEVDACGAYNDPVTSEKPYVKGWDGGVRWTSAAAAESSETTRTGCGSAPR